MRRRCTAHGNQLTRTTDHGPQTTTHFNLYYYLTWQAERGFARSMMVGSTNFKSKKGGKAPQATDLPSGNSKDLKCVRRRRLWSVVRGLCQLIPMCSTYPSHYLRYCRTMMAFQRTERRQWGGFGGGFPPSKDIITVHWRQYIISVGSGLRRICFIVSMLW